MNNDFNLFGSPDNSLNRTVDPDIALISAYLARELTEVQIIAVNDRLEDDAAFRDKVQPIIDAWTQFGSWAPGASDAARLRAIRGSSVTPSEIETGWNAYLWAAGRENAAPAPVAIQHFRHKTRREKIMRIAASVAAITLPVAVAAQWIIYSAAHDGAAGHSFARLLVPAAWRAQKNAPLHPDQFMDSGIVLGDGPVQITLDPPPQARPQDYPLVEVSSPTATTTEKFGAVLGIKETPDGRLLVNDVAKHQLKLFDQSLASSMTVLDSAPGSARSYPGGNAARAILTYLGDSLLFSDVVMNQFTVLDPFGRTVRSLAGASPNDALALIYRATGVDSRGRLVYSHGRTERAVPGLNADNEVLLPCSAALTPPRRGSCSPGYVASAPRSDGGGGRGGSSSGPPPKPGITVRIPTGGDSIVLRRTDFAARRTDSIAFLHQPLGTSGFETLFQPNRVGRLTLVLDADGKPKGVVELINPLFYVDDFAVLSDGTVAVLRGSDYHVDWIHPDGTTTSSPKLPFDWKRLTDSDKQKLVDSVKAQLDSANAWAIRRQNRTPLPTDSISAYDMAVRTNPTADCGVLIAIADRRTYPAAPCPLAPREWPYEFVPLSQINDYYPPFRAGATIPDRDGNLWILPRTTSLSKNGELVYDVVSPKSGFVKRVRLPVGRSIAGFGKGGVIYLQVGDLRSGFTIERVTVPGR